MTMNTTYRQPVLKSFIIGEQFLTPTSAMSLAGKSSHTKTEIVLLPIINTLILKTEHTRLFYCYPLYPCDIILLISTIR